MSAENSLRLLDVWVGAGDPRQAKKVEHDLVEVLVVAVCALLSGAGTLVKIEAWAKGNPDWLRQFAVPAREKPLPQARPAPVCLQQKRKGVARFRVVVPCGGRGRRARPGQTNAAAEVEFHDSNANAVAARETIREPP